MESRITRRLRRNRRRAFIQSYAFPSALADKLREHFDDERQVNVALEGLREWYLACLSAPGEVLGMPSKTVDVAWHEMILMTRIYHRFCEQAFGHYLHHSPDSVMDEPMRGSLARTLQVLEAVSPPLAGVPLLFAVDGELGIDDGFFWEEHEVDELRQEQNAVSRTTYQPHPGCVGAGGGCATVGGGGGGCGGGGGGGGGCGGGG
jgi:hypothetical protein